MWKWLCLIAVTGIVAFAALWFIAYRGILAEETALAQLPLPEAIERIRVQHQLPALAATAFLRGKQVEEVATGVRKVGAKNPVSTTDKWHFGSCGKSMTATLAAVLVDGGKLRWDISVAEALPDLPMHEGWRATTLEQLLQHRGGMPGDPPDSLWQTAWKRKGSPTEQRLAFVKGLLAEKPKHPAGKKFEYSNQGYALVGVMMERATGRAWEDLMRERLFRPLGMTTAGFGAPGTRGTTDQPCGHTGEVGALKPVEPGPNGDNPPAIAPAGTVHASLRDWARYASWHAARGRDSALPLKPETIARLHQPGPGQTYALGWETTERPWAGGLALTHAGSNTMWFAVVWVAPEKEAAFVAATNAAHDKAFVACDAAISQLIARVLPTDQ